jgi:hypothetical protein
MLERSNVHIYYNICKTVKNQAELNYKDILISSFAEEKHVQLCGQGDLTPPFGIMVKTPKPI